MILCWAAFTAILGCMWPVDHKLDTPAGSVFPITDATELQTAPAEA